MQHIGALQMRQDFIEIFWGVWGSEWATKTSFDSKIWFSKLTRNSLKLLFTLDFQKAIKCTLRRIISLALGHLRRSSINWNKNTLNGFTGHTRRPKIDDQTRKKKKKRNSIIISIQGSLAQAAIPIGWNDFFVWRLCWTRARCLAVAECFYFSDLRASAEDAAAQTAPNTSVLVHASKTMCFRLHEILTTLTIGSAHSWFVGCRNSIVAFVLSVIGSCACVRVRVNAIVVYNLNAFLGYSSGNIYHRQTTTPNNTYPLHSLLEMHATLAAILYAHNSGSFAHSLLSRYEFYLQRLQFVLVAGSVQVQGVRVCIVCVRRECTTSLHVYGGMEVFELCSWNAKHVYAFVCFLLFFFRSFFISIVRVQFERAHFSNVTISSCMLLLVRFECKAFCI